MQSDGGLTPVDSFRGSRAILSGPAGGVVGYASTSYGNQKGEGDGEPAAVIGFDMGGTSTGKSCRLLIRRDWRMTVAPWLGRAVRFGLIVVHGNEETCILYAKPFQWRTWSYVRCISW